MTEEEINKVVDALEKRLREQFFKDLGRGVWAFAWKVIVVGLLALAAYGAGVNGWLPKK